MDPVPFQIVTVSRNEDGTFSIALTSKNNGETPLVIRGSVEAVKALALALVGELLRMPDMP